MRGQTVQLGQLVNETPSMDVPWVRNGRVQALAQVGNTIIFGGTFTQVSDANGTALPMSYLGAYDKVTHKLVRTFRPALNGQVLSITPGAVANSIYIGGDFTTLNGVATNRVAALDVTTGKAVPGFTAAPANATVRVVALSAGKLFVGGTFTKMGGSTRLGLATLDPSTGKLTSYANLSFTGHHSYGVTPGSASMPVGIYDMAISPDGTQLTAIGNFRYAQGVLHDQVAQVSLTGATAAVRDDWKTSYFTAACYYWSFDSWVRTVRYSPDGSYFVIGSTGGSNRDLCDAVGRFETRGSGTDIKPTWIASTGGDSVFSLVATDSAIYAGGHFRWFNNPLAVDVAGPGAVARPGIVALDPQTGLPLPWNPGRHPRDKGVFAMLATDTDLTIGTDTEWIGNRQYRTYRLSNFPLAGGKYLAAQTPATVPGSLQRIPSGASTTEWQQTPLDAQGNLGTTATQPALVDLSSARAATYVDGRLFVIAADGTMTLQAPGQAPTVLDPYHDPYWSTVYTGVNAGETYRGVDSGFAGDASRITSMFYLNRAIYYTMSGSSQLYWRAFDSTQGITSPIVNTVPGVSLPDLANATLAGGWLYYSRASDGALVRAPFDGVTLGEQVVVGDPAAGDWRSQLLFATNP